MTNRPPDYAGRSDPGTPGSGPPSDPAFDLGPGGAGVAAAYKAPRDSQRSKVYRAESAVTDTNLSSLPACGEVIDRVVGSAWWIERFPRLTNSVTPVLRPGNGARRAFYRPEPVPSITLPRRYRLQGVVLHEMVHWALDGERDLADHGPTFTRILLDATAEFVGTPRANALTRAYRESGVKIGAGGRVDDLGSVRYGWDERLERRRHRTVTVVTPGASGAVHTTAVFLGWGRGKLSIRLGLADGERTSVSVSRLIDATAPQGPAAGGDRS